MNVKMQLRRAERKQAKVRIGLSGPSGSGKTYTALKLARGMASGGWNKIALIDTENRRGDLYSHLGDYFIITLEKPYTPERYIEAITACEEAGMEIIIIDSTSHEWDGEGGCLESNDLIAKTKFKGNTWAAWSITTPRHRRFIDAIIASPCHIITTLRSKTDTIQTDDKKIKKVGIKEIQREGFEYELTVSFELDRDGHYATVGKDNTEIFKNIDPKVLNEEDGKKIREWNEGGKADINAQKLEIMRQLKRLGWQTTDGVIIMAEVKKITGLDLVEANYQQIISLLAMTDPASLKKDETPKDPPQAPPAGETKKDAPADQAALDLKPKEETKEELPPKEEDLTPASATKIGMLKKIIEQKHKIRTEKEIVGFIDFIYDIKIEKLKDLTAAQADRLIKEILNIDIAKGAQK